MAKIVKRILRNILEFTLCWVGLDVFSDPSGLSVLLHSFLQLWDWLSSTDAKTSGHIVGISIQKW